VEFKVLGPLEVLDGGRPVAITAPKQRAMLAVLLVSANQVVPLDRMIEQLWGDEPPPRAMAALQVYVSSLRRAFEPHRPPRSPGRVLLSKPPGYVLVVDDDGFDAARFTTGIAAARGRLAMGDPTAAKHLLDGALALWRGPGYAEFADEPFAQAEASRLEVLRIIALETRAEADLALGRQVAVASELEGLTAQHPFREGLWASYLLALYRSGRQVEALRAYQRCRTTLTEELGIGPGPALRRLEVAILAQDASLDWRPERPDPLRTRPLTAPPGVRRADAGIALVGRSAELRRLRAAWGDVSTGRGACVLVSGEAGIGKTRLVEELAVAVAATGGDVAWGRCQEGEDLPAFWPWSQVVRSLLALHPPEAAADALREAALEPADLMPLGPRRSDGGSAEPPPLADPGAARFRLHQAVSAVVTALASERPLVIILDDLHWADEATLHLLCNLAPEVALARVLLIATYRDEEVVDDHPLVEILASLARRAKPERVVLDGLSRNEVASLVRAAAGREADPGVVERVYRRTNGNPFFVGEVVRFLVAEDALDDPTAGKDDEVPTGVRDVIRRRLARLPEATNAVLAIAAVVGPEFDLTVVEAVCGTLGDDVLDALEPARLGGVIAESPRSVHHCRFSHALLHETLYGGMGPLRRARVHARVADALEAGCGPTDAVELAHHLWRATEVVGTDRVLSALLRAAEDSMVGLAYEQAAEQLERAIDLLSGLPPSEERDRQELWAQVRFGMTLATTKGNCAPQVMSSFSRARELCARVTHPPEQLPTLYGLFLVSWIRLDFPVAATHAAQLLEVAQTTRDPTFVVAGHQALGLTAFEHGELATARHHFAQAMVMADSLADPWLAEVLQGDPSITSRCFGAFVHALYGDRAEASRLATEGLVRAQRSGHSWSIGVALNMRTWVAVVLREGASAERDGDEAAAYIANCGYEQLAAATTSMRGWALAYRGDTDAGLQMVEAGRRAREATGMHLMVTFNMALAAEVEHRAGRTAEALATVHRALVEVEATGERFYQAELHRLHGELLLASAPERAAEAEVCFSQAVEVAHRQGARLLEQRACPGTAGDGLLELDARTLGSQ
jgi:DNA-binding SARP family transcriptional activator